MRTAIRLWVLVAFAALTSRSALAQPGYTGDPGSYTQRQGIPYVTHDASCTGKGTSLSPLSCGTGGGTGSFSSFTDTGPFFLTGTIGPAAITGTVNNWNPCDSVSVSVCLANTNGVRVALSGASSLTGLVAQSSGFQIEFRNTSSTLALTLLNQSASSTAANRFLLPNSASWVVPPQGSVILRYSTSAGAWAPASSNNNNLVGTALAVSGTSSLADVAATSIADSGALVLTGSIAPTALAGSVNNYAPCDVTTPANCLATTNLVRQDASVASTVTGLAAQASGQAVALLNISATNSITLTNEDVASVAANRFTLPNGASWVIPPGGAVLLRYSSATSRWRPEQSNNNNVNATALTVSGTSTLSGTVVINGDQASTLTGTQNDTPVNANINRYVWNGASAATFDGFTCGGHTCTSADNGYRFTFVNVSANAATLAYEAAGSSAANRVSASNGVARWVPAHGACDLVYEGTTSLRWHDEHCGVRADCASGESQQWDGAAWQCRTVNDYRGDLDYVDEFYRSTPPDWVSSGQTGTGASSFGITSATGRPGIVDISTGTTSTGNAVWAGSTASFWDLTTQTVTVDVVGGWLSLSNSTDAYGFESGLGSTTTSLDQTNGCFFLYDSQNVASGGANTGLAQILEVASANGGSRTIVPLDGATHGGVTTVSTPVAALTLPNTNMYTLTVIASSTQCVFQVKGVTVATLTTTIPTSGVTHMFFIQKSAGTSNVHFQADRLHVHVHFTIARSL